MGDHVYLRNSVLGRNKIQDFWRPELHRLTSRPFDSNVNMTQPQAGGSERAVHRKDRPPLLLSPTLTSSLHLRGRTSVTLSQTMTTNCAFCHRRIQLLLLVCLQCRHAPWLHLYFCLDALDVEQRRTLSVTRQQSYPQYRDRFSNELFLLACVLWFHFILS